MPETPYRDHWNKCPACPNAQLRAFAGRLLCDTCQGMLITPADLAQAIADLTGAEPELAFFADKPTKRACPRCDHAMTACRLRIVFAVVDKEREPRPILDRCEQDGIWFDTGELAKVFEVVRGAVGNRGTGGGSGGGYTGGAARGGFTWWPGA
jgi:hypothetical protein